MKVELSERLRHTAELVTRGLAVADIGCDHAYTSMYLLQNGIASKVIAMDINKGPLQIARRNIAEYGWNNQIETRLSDGAKELQIGEVDCLLISGMGGPLMCKILGDRLDILDSVEELILQPQSEVAVLRHFLHEHGFCILGEDMVFEEGKYYVMMKARKGIEHYTQEYQYIYGNINVQKNVEVCKQYLSHQLEKVEKLMIQLPDTEKANQRREELMLEKVQVQRVLELV